MYVMGGVTPPFLLTFFRCLFGKTFFFDGGGGEGKGVSPFSDKKKIGWKLAQKQWFLGKKTQFSAGKKFGFPSVVEEGGEVPPFSAILFSLTFCQAAFRDGGGGGGYPLSGHFVLTTS